MAYEKASAVKGHHFYKSIWTAVTFCSVPQSLLCLHEQPSLVPLHQIMFLLAPLVGSFRVQLELSCSCPLEGLLANSMA